jgi:hypothetical protein
MMDAGAEHESERVMLSLMQRREPFTYLVNGVEKEPDEGRSKVRILNYIAPVRAQLRKNVEI